MPSASYAIDLMLSLDTTVAEERLNGVLSQIEEIQQSLIQLANTKVDVNVETLVKQLQAAEASAKSYAASNLDTLSSISSSVTSMQKGNDLQETMEELLEGSRDHIVEMEDHLEQFYKKKFPTINRQAKDLRNESSVIQGIWQFIKRDIGGLAGDFTRALGGLFSLRAAFHQVWQEENQLLTLNFRYYGSVGEVSQATRDLTSSFGLLRQNAIAAYAAVAGTRAPREEIFKLAGHVGLLAEASGIAVQRIADWERRLRIAGHGTGAFNNQINWLTNAMVNFGLTGEQIAKIMDVQSNNAITMSAILGDKGAANIVKMTAALQSLGDAFGTQDDAAAKLMEKFHSLDKVGFDARTSILGTTEIIRDQDELIRRMASQSTLWGQALNKLELGQDGKIKGMDKLEGDLIWMNELAKSMQIPLDELIALTMAVRHSNAQSVEEFVETAEKMVESEQYVSESARKALEEKKRQQDVLAGYNAMVDELRVIWMELWVELRPILTTIIELVRTLIPVIRGIVSAFKEFVDVLFAGTDAVFGLGGALSDTDDKVKTTSGTVSSLVQTLNAVQEPFKVMYDWLFGTAEASERAGKSISGFIKTVIGLTIAFGVVYVAWTLLNQLVQATPVTKLLAVGAALLMIGGGFLMLGGAVAMMAATGGQGLLVLGLLSGAILALAGAIAVVSAFGPIGIGATLALSVAFLALGAAALMVAAAVKWSVDAIISLAAIATPELATSLLMIGAAYVAFAASLLLASAMIIPATVAMAGAMVGLGLAVMGLYAIIGTVESAGAAFLSLGLGFKLISEHASGASSGISKMRTEVRGLLNEAKNAASLQSQLVDITTAVNSAAGSIDQSASSIGSAIDALGIALGKSLDTANVAVVRQIDEYAAVLDAYADKIVGSSNRIHTAYMEKLKPVWDWANTTGMEKTVKGEAVAYVKIMREDDFTKSLQQRARQREAEESTKILRDIRDKLDAVSVDDTAVKKIGNLLETYLPHLASGNRELSHMTGWMR